MEIDIYQQCPCYSGKKIKFCCGKDIVADLNQIVAKCRSNQSLSALDQIESVIARSGERDCLVTLQTHILFVLGETDRATEVNRKFAARNPHHPIALQHEALSMLADGEFRDAIEKLQDAMDSLKTNEIPLTMAIAFRMIGSILLQLGHIIAARAHLQFAVLIRGEENSEAEQRLIHQSFRVPGAPLVFKTDFRLEPTPVEKEWSGKYENVIRAMNRGQFRLGLRILERINQQWPEQKEVVRSIAVAQLMLAHDGISEAWFELSKLDSIPRWQAVEARALSLLFADDDPSGSCEDVAAEWEISDLDQAWRLAASSNRLEEGDCPDEDPLEEGPAPRHAFRVLDRERLTSLEDRTANEIPHVVGELFLFGRQTDRNSRLLLLATRNDNYQPTLEMLNRTFGELMTTEIDEEVLSESSIAGDLMSWRWQIPPGTNRSQHVELINEYRRIVLLEKWTNIPFTCLDNLTPIQAGQREDLSIAMEALLLNLEQSHNLQMSDGSDMVELRRKIGVDEPERLDATTLDDALLTPLRIRNIDPKTLSDDQLRKLFGHSFAIANTVVLKTITPEILERDGLAEDVPRDMCYSLLAQLSDDEAEVLDYLAKARQEAKRMGQNVGVYLVQEFEFRLSRGLTEKLPGLLQMIQKQHMSDPEVEFQMRRVLSKFGLIGSDGRMVSLPASVDENASTPKASAIWTPDSETNQPTGAGGSSASKIWVPGSD